MVKFKVNTKSFIKCIDFAYASAPMKDIRKQLNSIQLTFNSEHKALVFVATNGHHLSAVKLSVDDKEGDFEGSFDGFEFLIPTESVKQIKTMFGKDKFSISVQVADGKMIIEGDDKTSVVNSIKTESRYPDTSRYIKISQDESLHSLSHAKLNPDYVSKLAKAFNEISEDKWPSMEITFTKVSNGLVLFTTQTTLPENVFEPISVLMPMRN